MENDFLNSLEKMTKEDIPFDSNVREKFLIIFSSKFGKDNAESFYEEQSNLFRDIVISSDGLKKCSGFSLFNAFIAIAINGLSLEKTSTTQCFLESRNIKIGKRQTKDGEVDVWETRATLKISGYGELLIRQRMGQIKYANNPVIVYDCDKFEYGERDGKTFVDYTKRIPRPHDAKTIAGFLKITRSDGTIDYKVMDMEDVVRLRNYSIKNNSKYDYQHKCWTEGKPNALYGNSNDGSDIDTGFFAAKLIKHAFKTYSRITVGDGAVMQADDDEQPVKEEPVSSFGPTESVQGVQVKEIDSSSPF